MVIKQFTKQIESVTARHLYQSGSEYLFLYLGVETKKANPNDIPKYSILKISRSIFDHSRVGTVVFPRAGLG